MLKVVLDLGRIADSQAFYRLQGTVLATQTARRIMRMRDSLKHKAARFQDRQQAAAANGDAFMQDGRQATIDRKILSHYGRKQWPMVAAAILQGSRLPGTNLHPTARCPNEDPAWVGCHEAHLFTLYDGHAKRREFSELAALAVYLAPLNEIAVIWIGLETDLAAQVSELTEETKGWTDLTPISPRCDELLTENCQFYVKTTA
jgi:hypothetical protein